MFFSQLPVTTDAEPKQGSNFILFHCAQSILRCFKSGQYSSQTTTAQGCFSKLRLQTQLSFTQKECVMGMVKIAQWVEISPVEKNNFVLWSCLHNV